MTSISDAATDPDRCEREECCEGDVTGYHSTAPMDAVRTYMTYASSIFGLRLDKPMTY
jgi:hypothetical protein